MFALPDMPAPMMMILGFALWGFGPAPEPWLRTRTCPREHETTMIIMRNHVTEV